MARYKGKIIEGTYKLYSFAPRPVYEDDLTRKFSDDEHRLFASGADMVLITRMPGQKNQELAGYWEKRRDISKLEEDIPIRMVTYAQMERKGIPATTRLGFDEISRIPVKPSLQTRAVQRRY